MKNWSVVLSEDPVATLDCDVLILGLIPGPENPSVHEPSLPDHHVAQLNQWLANLGVGSGKNDAKKLPAPEGFTATSIVVVGCESSTPTPDDIRYAAGVGTRLAGDAARIAVALPQAGPLHTVAAIEGALLGAHTPARMGAARHEAPDRTLVIRGAASSEDVTAATATAHAVTWVRDLVTEPPNSLYPETFVDRVRTELSGLPIEIDVFDEEALRQGGFGGLMGVGGGSVRPPRLVALRYRPEGAHTHIALVGKGITFDSGGLSLKPAGSMVGMKYDMTGAATVAGAVMAASAVGAPVSVTGWLCLAENMPSGSALRPNDVITIRGGKTVEVLNTDAEGRLVLADGLQRASEDTPDLIIDVATLTGAARVALGERYAGVMGHDKAVGAVQSAAQEAGELVWPMPLARELRALLDTDVADIANAKPGNSLGGMILAALFLEEFVGPRNPDDEQSPPIPWAHVDMAGPASNSSAAFGYTPKGPTGALVRTLIGLLRHGDQHVAGVVEQ